MPKRNRLLQGSTVLLVAVATGCATPTPNSSALGPQDAAQRATGGNLISNNAGGLISNNAGGLISNNAGGLVSNNAGGLISNNAGGLISTNAGGLISNNAGGLISNNAGGLISNNAGGLTGTVRGPAAGLISNNAGGLISNNAGGLISNNAGGLISNNAGGLISNNAGGLVSNNAGGLISNNAGGYKLLDADGDAGGADITSPIADCQVGVFNERDEMISYNWTTTDADGNYIFTALKASGPLLFVKAKYTREGQQIVLVSTAPAPRKAGLVNCTITPATTIVAKKFGEMIRLRAVNAATIRPSTASKLAAALAPALTERSIVAAAIFSNDRAASTFDNMIKEAPAALQALIKTATVNASAVVATTPAAILPDSADNAAPAPGAVPAEEAPPIEGGVGAPAPAPEGGGSAPSIDAPPPASNAGGSGSAGSAGTTDSAAPPADGGTAATPEAPPSVTKGLVTTLGKVKSATRIEINAAGQLFAPNAGGLQTGTVSSIAKDSLTLTDGAGTAKAYAFANGQRYDLDGGAVKFGSTTVPLTGIDTSLVNDLAVKGNFAYITSAGQNCIYRLDLTAGTTDIFAGTPSFIGGNADGDGAAAAFNQPKSITVGDDGLYVTDTYNRKIRKITFDGSVSTFVGGAFGSKDGAKGTASFLSPIDLCMDGAGNLLVADQGSHTVRLVKPDGTTSTIAGNRDLGDTDGVGDKASLAYPTSLNLVKIGGQDALVVGEMFGNVRVVTNW